LLGVGLIVSLYQPRGFWARRKCDKFTPPAALKVAPCDFITMTIKQDDIEKIAELARIRISAEEIGQVTRRITEILQMVARLQAVDTLGVEPMANPLDAIQCLRPDEVTQSNRRDAFQAIAPAVENGLYLVPRVIE
jgi:aspartyl-tRNA(Asn)/glutamyl-tRNA(Gln) amidotransferase subunit C